MSRRVVVTGMGAITPLGNDVQSFWEGLVEGKSGVGPITKFDTTDYKVKLAAEVKDFDPKLYMDFKSAKRMELFSQYAVAASKMALDESGLDLDKEDLFRVGVIIGCGVGSLQASDREHEKLMNMGPARVNPLFIPMMISNMAAGNVAIQFGLKGKNIDVVTACASGTNSIGEAFHSIKHGEAEVILAGGTESAVCPLGVAGFTALTALSTNEDASLASRPFDKDRDGFVIGEGSGVIVLEELEHAKARGAKILAEIVGYGSTCDAYHITSPAEDGSGAGMAMIMAMNEANASPSDVEYINAHGTSTHHNDLFETRAIKYAFKDHAKKLKINSTKSMTGHLLGAAGGIEAIVCVKSICEDYIHVTAGSSEADEDMDLDYCFGSGVHTKVNYAMSNSLGFGGHNASILLKKYEA